MTFNELINTMPDYCFLAQPQLRQLNAHLSAPARLELSFDLGRSYQHVEIDHGLMILNNALKLPLPSPELFNADDDRTILIYRNNGWEKWQRFDESQNKFYKMIFVADGAPPTVEINGIKMHVTQDGDPALDTRRKLKALGRVAGTVLDTCCGLGYSALALCEQSSVQHVWVCEVDANMVEFCRENPWSSGLWNHPKIRHQHIDITVFLGTLADKSVNGILHDPPRFTLAPELYSECFYGECWRVLQAGGRLYHYTGDPHKHKGRSLPDQTIGRLKKCGFRKAYRAYQGVVAVK